MIYIFIFILLFLCRNSRDKKLFFFIGAFLSIVLGYRGIDVGTDTHSYIEYFGYADEDSYMEFFWNKLVLFIKNLGLSAYTFNFFIAILSISAVCHVASKESDKPIKVLFFLYSLGFYFYMFNVMRQLFAVCIVLIGFTYLKRGKRKTFLGIVALASLFHLSSLVAVLALFVRSLNLSFRKYLWIIFGTSIVGVLIPIEYIILISFKYAHDVDSSGDLFRTSIIQSVMYLLFTNGLLVSIFWFYKDVLFDSNKIKQRTLITKQYDDLHFWLKIIFVGNIIFNVFVNLLVGLRIAYTFTISEIILFSVLPKRKGKSGSWLLNLYALLTFLRFIIAEYNMNGASGALIPYTFNFEL